jgi:AraC family transcriptional activator of pobA
MARKKPFIISWHLEELSRGIPFVIERMEIVEDEHDPMMVAHRHGYYAIGICIEGQSAHMIDFERIELGAKDMMMIVPGQVHHPIGIHTGSGWLIAFSAEFLAGQAVTLPLAATPKIILSPDDFAQVVTITQLMEKEHKEQAPQYAAVLQHYLSVLITLLQRNTNTASAQPGPALLLRYRELLATHFLEWTKPTQYASALHISANHLNEVIKQHTGQTATALITERRLLEAKRLLLHSRESIKEIAWHLQFNEVSYFNKFFKLHTGYTPASFKDSLREKYQFIPE